ncbi:hypothetical protein HMPREF0580_1122, partial [Mobiluncus mulieris ATCC 35239]
RLGSPPGGQRIVGLVFGAAEARSFAGFRVPIRLADSSIV